MARRGLYGTLACLIAMTFGVAQAGAAPAPCGAPQITDVAGDGHHVNTDVVSAWLSEQSGRLQAVIKVNQALWEPAHEDSEFASLAFLFDAGGQTRYVRVEAPRPTQGPIKYDYGIWTGGGGFLSAGPIAGEVFPGPGGTVTLDVPGATGAVTGSVLSRLFVLTWDGVGAEPHWVDRAPGGVSPAGTDYGADYRVGSCGTGGGGGGATGYAVASVVLNARKWLVGGGTVRVRGSVLPARAGVPVEVTAKARKSVVRKLVTGSDGAFSASIRVSENTQLRALAGGIGSQTHTVTVKSRVRIKVRRRGGRVVVRGTVRPKLPGRVLLLRTTSALPAARTKARNGRFTFRFKRLRRGRYQAVFIPSKGRAERATSNKGAVR
jgi:hypothetical protein